MHINPNATLLVQIFHFGIAYVLLRNLLLKPAIKARKQEQAVTDTALELISRRQQHIEQALYTQNQLWRSCNIYYATHKPIIENQAVFRNLTRSIPVVQFSEEEKNKAITKASELIQKIIGERL